MLEDGEVGELDEHADDEGGVDEGLVWEGGGGESEHERGVAGGGGHAEQGVLRVGEFKAAGEDFPEEPSGDKEAEYSGEDDKEGGGVANDGGDVSGEDADDEGGDDEGDECSGEA